jgi:UDP-glucose 4-epimerase
MHDFSSLTPVQKEEFFKIIENSEYYLRLINNKSVNILRIANPYGGSQILKNNQGIVPYIYYSIRNNETIKLFGNTVRDYIYIDDVVKVIICSLEYDNGFSIFNVGTGVGTSLHDLYRKISKIINKNTNIEYFEKRTFDVENNILDISKAKQLLNWKPEFSLEKGLLKYFNNETT